MNTIKKIKTLILTKTNDPRNIEFYEKCFPGLSPIEQEKLRARWINYYKK